MSKLLPPPWLVAGATIDVVKDSKEKTLTFVFASDPNALTDDQWVEVLTFTETMAKRFERVVPEGWKVVA